MQLSTAFFRAEGMHCGHVVYHFIAVLRYAGGA
jgi:hypothetical protein